MIATSKSEFLARHRTFHLGHSRVTDPLFAVDSFFDPRDLLLVKYEMLRRVRVDCWSVVRAARQAGLSRTAWYDALHHWERSGLVGLLPDTPGPRARTRIASGFPTAHAGRDQKRGSMPPTGTSATRACGAIGSTRTLPGKWFSFCGKGCWPGYVARGASTRLRLRSFTRHQTVRCTRPSWIATWSSPSPNYC